MICRPHLHWSGRHYLAIFRAIQSLAVNGLHRYMSARSPPQMMNKGDVQTASSNLPVIGQIANGADYLQDQLGSAINDFKNIYSEVEDAFCTPAQYAPPTNVPANLTGAPL